MKYYTSKNLRVGDVIIVKEFSDNRLFLVLQNPCRRFECSDQVSINHKFFHKRKLNFLSNLNYTGYSMWISEVVPPFSKNVKTMTIFLADVVTRKTWLLLFSHDKKSFKKIFDQRSSQ